MSVDHRETRVVVTQRQIKQVVSTGTQGPKGAKYTREQLDSFYDPLGAADYAEAAAAADASAKDAAHVAAPDPHPQYATGSALSDHTGNTSNPHSVTKAQVGLGNVDNTSDANKPVSTAQQAELNGKEATIAAGTTSQYWRGNKSWRDFATDVRASVLTGLSTASATVVAAADSVLVSIGKLQAQISDIVTQADAEAGTSTTRKSWTALRVRQAIAAWWLTASSAFGRTLANIADAAAGRTALGLGSASTLTAGQADANLPTNTDIRSYYGVKYKPAVAPTLVIDFENSYFAIYNASTNSLFVADNWDAFSTHLGADLTVSRAGEQTYFDAIGVMRTAAADTIQCDHDPLTGRRLGPYIGRARTNILLASEVPATQSVNVTGQAYTLSFYGTGTVTLSGAHTATLVGSGAFPVRSTLTVTPTAGPLTLTVSGDAQKFQLEAGADASPYIPTTTSAATRPATTVSIGGTKFAGCFRQAQGTFVLQYNRPWRTALISAAMSVGDGTTQNRMYFLTSNSSGTVFDYFDATVAGVSQGFAGYAVIAAGRAAFSYATNNVVVGKNGVSYTNSTFAAPVVSKLDLGHRDGDAQINGRLTGVTYYPVALSTTSVVELAK